MIKLSRKRRFNKQSKALISDELDMSKLWSWNVCSRINENAGEERTERKKAAEKRERERDREKTPLP